MKIAVPRESEALESRVAATPDTVKKLIALGCQVVVQQGAGVASNIADEAYEEAGAKLEKSGVAVLKAGDVVLKVRRPSASELKNMKKGALLVAMMDPFGAADEIRPFANKGITAFSMELMPRITRAQTMDVLSSQSNLAGYKAVVDAAAEFNRALPMMMTAAGTVPAARVFIMGAGVAGLQAIATARRLGAMVSATDVRRAAGEQVASLGAKFVMVEAEEDAETAGGYAKEMSEDYKRKQAELISETVRQQDIVVCTALIPGRPAPILVTREMVESMKPGSIIVDLAVERGGNCELAKPGEVVVHKGVTIIGHTNMAGRIAGNASQLYAKNLLNFLDLILGKEQGEVTIDWDDEIISATGLTRDGELVNPVLG